MYTSCDHRQAFPTRWSGGLGGEGNHNVAAVHVTLSKHRTYNGVKTYTRCVVCVSKCPRRVGSIAVVQDRARDLSYLGWRLTPIYDPDPLSEGVEGIEDDTALPEEPGVRVIDAFREGVGSR